MVIKKETKPAVKVAAAKPVVPATQVKKNLSQSKISKSATKAKLASPKVSEASLIPTKIKLTKVDQKQETKTLKKVEPKKHSLAKVEPNKNLTVEAMPNKITFIEKEDQVKNETVETQSLS